MLLSDFQSFMLPLLSEEKNAASPFARHTGVDVICDALSRKYEHHLRLSGFSSETMYLSLLQNVANHFKDSCFLYLDSSKLLRLGDVIALTEQSPLSQKQIILAVNSEHVESSVFNVLLSMKENPRWRIILIEGRERSDFTTIKLAPPAESEIIALLKDHKIVLENFHQLSILDESVDVAVELVKRYLTSTQSFNKTLVLLDSAAARAVRQCSAVLQNEHIIQVFSGWTPIPAIHLQTKTFNALHFREVIQRQVVGQENAITALSTALQYAYVPFCEKSGPLCSFLWVGPPGVGKSTTARVMAEHLFGHDAVLRVNLAASCESLADVTLQAGQHAHQNLLTAVNDMPYAMILIEDVHQASADVIRLFTSVLSLGYAVDKFGKVCDFSRCMIVMTTTLGADRIMALTETPPVHEINKTLDLIDLVLNDSLPETASLSSSGLSHHEMCEELLPILESHFPASLLQQLNIIPFSVLDVTALEHIMDCKMKALVKKLYSQFKIELHYASDVIRFLAHEALWRKPQSQSLDNIVEQSVYSVIAVEVLNHAENKHRPRRLFLQLNEKGNLLRCEKINALDSALFIMP